MTYFFRKMRTLCQLLWDGTARKKEFSLKPQGPYMTFQSLIPQASELKTGKMRRWSQLLRMTASVYTHHFLLHILAPVLLHPAKQMAKLQRACTNQG